MMNKEFSIQVYSVRDMMTTAEQTADTFKKLASYGYTGIQTAGAFTFGVEAYAEAAKAAGLKVVGTHLDMDTLEKDIQETVRIHRLLGTTNVGIGSFGPIITADASTEDVLAFTKRANALGEALKPYGMKFTFHHHAREFAKIGHETIMDILAREMNPETTSFVLDTCWLQAGCVSVVEWIEKLAGRVDILHLKDRGIIQGTNDGMITELGAGNINFKAVLKAAENAGVKDFCYEQDNNHKINSLESAKQSAEYFFSLL